MGDEFSQYHPLVNFLWCALVLLFSMCLLHPVCLVIALCAALCYSGFLDGARALGRRCLCYLPLLLAAAALNAAFNHAGITTLCYLPSGNPLTLEALRFGAAMAALLLAVLTEFACFQRLLGTDKFVYLFGRAAPVLSLLLSMTLRFVPRFAAHLRTVREAQRALSGAPEHGLHRVRSAVRAFSAAVTWALENAVDTADSMCARGYGLPGRSAYNIYRWERRDRAALLWLLLCGAGVAAGWAGGCFAWRYVPVARFAALTPRSALAAAAYLALCLTPLALSLYAARHETICKLQYNNIMKRQDKRT